MAGRTENEVRVVERIAALLNAVGEQESCSLTELSEACGLAISTTSRLLESLERVNFMRRDSATKRYQLGGNLFRLTANSKPRQNVISIVHPILEWLAAEIGEDCGLAELQATMAVIIDRADGKHHLKIIDVVSQPELLYFGAFRKVLLAFQDETWIASYIRGISFKKFSATTITDAPTLRRELAKIRRQGYGTSYGEKLVDAAGVAAPVFDFTGHVRAALQIVAPAIRLHPTTAPRYIEAVVRAAARASALLGGGAYVIDRQPDEVSPKGRKSGHIQKRRLQHPRPKADQLRKQ